MWEKILQLILFNVADFVLVFDRQDLEDILLGFEDENSLVYHFPCSDRTFEWDSRKWIQCT